MVIRISDMARRTGVSPDTIRYYERRGLLVDVQRTEGGFRVYGEPAMKRVLLIRRALAFGFSLAELRGFLSARDRGVPPCRQVRMAAGKKLEAVETQLRYLRSLRSTMRRALAEWDERLDGAAPGEALHLLEDLPAVAFRTGPFTIDRGVHHANNRRDILRDSGYSAPPRVAAVTRPFLDKTRGRARHAR